MSTLLLWVCGNSETWVEEGVCKVEDTLRKGATHTNWSGCLFTFLKYKHRIPSQCLWRLLFGVLRWVVNIKTLSTVVCFPYIHMILYLLLYLLFGPRTLRVCTVFLIRYMQIIVFILKCYFCFTKIIKTIACSISLPYKTWMPEKRIKIWHKLLGWQRRKIVFLILQRIDKVKIVTIWKLYIFTCYKKPADL